MNKSRIDNLQPFSIMGLPVTIPAGQSAFTQFFNGYSIALDPKNFNYIPYISCRIDTAGVYNITTQETFQLNGVPVIVNPGNYGITDLQTLANVVIPLSGAFSFFATNNQTLQFTTGSRLAFILGYSSFGSLLIPVGTRGTAIVDQTNDNDTILIQCDLIGQSNSLGNNYLAAFNIGGQTANTVFFERLFIQPPTPIILTNISAIEWKVTKFDGTPFISNSPIQLFFRIGSQQK